MADQLRNSGNPPVTEPRFYVVTRAAHSGHCVVDRETGLVVLDGLTREQADIEASFRNSAAA